MGRIAYDEKKEPEELVPGDYFDFIGGTGFGGCVSRPYRRGKWLIWIYVYISFMLGTVRMNLDNAIDGLLTLADALFTQSDPGTVRTPDENLDTVPRAARTFL
jgi:hypothetical protein